jgi:hypothetical protein
MSTRVRKLLTHVFLIAIPLVTSVANPIPAPTQSPINPSIAGHTPNSPPALQNSTTPARNASRSPRPHRYAKRCGPGDAGGPTLRYSSTPVLHSFRVYQESPANETDLNDSYDVFYDQLSADGHWIFAENYGYVFQPTVAASNADWRPYTNGHWEATDRGWYWDTEEPFGWATYHYGRWANIDGTGWVWAPGTDWSPAWVSWRICDNGFIGWAPLSPECPRPSEAVAIGGWCDSYSDTGPEAFCFLPFSAWFNSSYVGALAPVTQNLQLINASRNVTNISVSKTIINDFGPRPEVIAQETGREIKTYLLHYSEVRGQHNFGRSIADNVLNISGPAAKLKANAIKVPTVIKTIVRPTVNKGWNGLTKDDVDAVHSKYAAEAHIPSHLPTKPIERVNMVPSATPAVIRPVRDQKEKEKEPKESKETAEKEAAKKGNKGKTENASAHKGTPKHKTASASEEEGGSKGESKSKLKSKTAKASKDTDDTDESDEAKSSKKTASSSKSSSHKNGTGSKSSGSSKVAKASKETDDTDESENPKRKTTSSSKSGARKSGEGPKGKVSKEDISKETKKSSKEKEDE